MSFCLQTLSVFPAPNPSSEGGCVGPGCIRHRRPLTKRNFTPGTGICKGLRVIGPSSLTPCLKQLKVKLPTQKQGEQPQPHMEDEPKSRFCTILHWAGRGVSFNNRQESPFIVPGFLPFKSEVNIKTKLKSTSSQIQGTKLWFWQGCLYPVATLPSAAVAI